MSTKRIIKELDAYHREASSALDQLEPVNDDDLFHLTAVLRGPGGTAYEGKERESPRRVTPRPRP
jgi:peroxin-4